MKKLDPSYDIVGRIECSSLRPYRCQRHFRTYDQKPKEAMQHFKSDLVRELKQSMAVSIKLDEAEELYDMAFGSFFEEHRRFEDESWDHILE